MSDVVRIKPAVIAGIVAIVGSLVTVGVTWGARDNTLGDVSARVKIEERAREELERRVATIDTTLTILLPRIEKQLDENTKELSRIREARDKR